MFKPFLVAAAVLMIPVSGLLSCSPDKTKTKVVDNFRANPPKILRGDKGDLQVTKENAETLQSLDLHDRFDFSNSGGKYVIIKSTCKVQGSSLTVDALDTRFEIGQPIPVYQIVPPELLHYDLKNSAVNCTYQSTTYNAVGSTHAMIFPALQLTDERPAGLTVARDGQAPSTFTAGDTAGVMIRSPTGISGSARLDCQDVRFPPVAFERSLSLDSFALAQPEPADPAKPDARFQRPEQICRVYIRYQDEIAELNSLIKIKFRLPPLTVTVLPTDKAPHVPGGLQFPMATIRVQNPAPAERTVVVTHKHHEVIAVGYAGYKDAVPGGENAFVSRIRTSVPYGFTGPFESGDVVGSQKELKVPANGVLDIPVWFRYNHQFVCGHGKVYGHTLQLTGLVDLAVRDPQGTLEGNIRMENFPEVWGYLEPGTKPGDFKDVRQTKACGFY